MKHFYLKKEVFYMTAICTGYKTEKCCWYWHSTEQGDVWTYSKGTWAGCESQTHETFWWLFTSFCGNLHVLVRKFGSGCHIHSAMNRYPPKCQKIGFLTNLDSSSLEKKWIYPQLSSSETICKICSKEFSFHRSKSCNLDFSSINSFKCNLQNCLKLHLRSFF